MLQPVCAVHGNCLRKLCPVHAGCEFKGFSGDNSPLLVASDSYAALHSCAFRDLDLTVEVFDLSFGGRLQLEDCTFENVRLRRQPPKLVSTSRNDEAACDAPYDDSFKYHADDDDAYDIVHSDILGFGDTPLELIVDNATASDCLRALHEYVILLMSRILLMSCILTIDLLCVSSASKERTFTLNRE